MFPAHVATAMTNEKDKSTRTAAPAPTLERRRRQAEALRRNLLRRKAQERQRSGGEGSKTTVSHRHDKE